MESIKKTAGKISPTPMGDYDDTTIYRRLDWVYYGGTSYICKKNNTFGIKPSDSDRWQKIVDATSDMAIIFTEAEQLENIVSGDKLSIIFGKLQKWYTHIYDIISVDNPDITRIRADKEIQVTDRNNEKNIPIFAKDFLTSNNRSLEKLNLYDISSDNQIEKLNHINQITSIGFYKISDIDGDYANAIGIDQNVGDFYAIVADYNGDGAASFEYGNVLLFSPRLGDKYYYINVWQSNATAIKSVLKSNLLNTIEQISANTSADNVAGALALKAAMADYNNKIGQINSNLADKLTNNGYYAAQNPDGSGISINDMTNPGIYRFYVNSNTGNANYLGWTGRTIILCTGDCAGYKHQIFFAADTAKCAIRRNITQNDIVFDYDVPLHRIDNKIAHPLFKQLYGVNVSGGQISFQSGDNSGIILELPAFCKYVEFEVTKSTYGQYGVCEEGATLPTIQSQGQGRLEYKLYKTPGKYRYDVNGVFVRYFYITLNSGTLKNVKVEVY